MKGQKCQMLVEKLAVKIGKWSCLAFECFEREIGEGSCLTVKLLCVARS